MPRGRHGGRRCRPKIKKCVHFLWRPVSKNVKLCESARPYIRFSRFSGTCEPRHGRGARHSWRARAGAPPRLRRAGTRGGGSYHPVRVARSRARGSATARGGRRREGRERGSRGARLRRGCGEALAREGGGDVGGDRAARAQARGVQRLHEGARDAARTLARSRARPGSPPRPPRPSPSRGGSARGFRAVKPRAAIGKFDIAAPRPSKRDPARSAPTDPRPAPRRDATGSVLPRQLPVRAQHPGRHAARRAGANPSHPPEGPLSSAPARGKRRGANDGVRQTRVRTTVCDSTKSLDPLKPHAFRGNFSHLRK